MARLLRFKGKRYVTIFLVKEFMSLLWVFAKIATKHTIKYTQYERVRFSLGTFCTPKNRRHTNKKRNVIR